MTWGFFEGGFDLTVTNANGTTGCKRSTTSAVTNTNKADYIPHHEPFQYYKSTANPTHARPTSVSIDRLARDAANHQYDIHDFYDAVNAGNFPAVSFLKAPGYQDGHAGYSDPLDEQAFIVHGDQFPAETAADWEHTAVVIAYDDSDGWYDHQMPPIVNQSTSAADRSPGRHLRHGASALPGVDAGDAHAQGRCGYGPRLPHAGDLAVVEAELRRSHDDRSDLDHSLHRRQLAERASGSATARSTLSPIPSQNMLEFTKAQSNDKLILDPQQRAKWLTLDPAAKLS